MWLVFSDEKSHLEVVWWPLLQAWMSQPLCLAMRVQLLKLKARVGKAITEIRHEIKHGQRLYYTSLSNSIYNPSLLTDIVQADLTTKVNQAICNVFSRTAGFRLSRLKLIKSTLDWQLVSNSSPDSPRTWLLHSSPVHSWSTRPPLSWFVPVVVAVLLVAGWEQ